MKKLLLITDGFPYGQKERSFLSEEYRELEKNFSISIAALSSNQERIHQWPQPEFLMNLTWSKIDLLKNAHRLFKKNVRAEAKLAKKSNPTNKRSVYWVRRYELLSAHYEKCLYEYLRKNPTDIIYTYWCTPATLAAVRIKKKHPELKLKVLSRFHGYDLYKERTEGAMWQPFRGEISEGLDLLLFVSAAGKDYYKSQWPQAADSKLLVSYLGSKEPDEYVKVSKEDEGLTIVSCSDCIPLKRIHLIIEALSRLEINKKCRWIHLGDGPLLEELKEQAKAMLGQRKNISAQFLGRVPHEEISKIYKRENASLFITTSSTEGLPISVTEAISMGIPVLATDVGGMKELVNESNGFLFDKDTDADGIAKLIADFAVLSEDRKKSYFEAAIKHWKNGFDAKRNASELVKKICDL